MKRPLKGKPRKILKIFIWVSGLLIVYILSVSLIGYTGDRIAQPKLDELREEAKKYFEDYQKQGGFQKPVYFEELEDGNAWDFYSRASDAINHIPLNEREIIQNFLWKSFPTMKEL
jgi:hypothetical protein